jgi:hypothetical protein
MAQIQDDLAKEAVKKGTRIDEDELTKRINSLLEMRGSDLGKSLMNYSPEITEEIKELSKQTSLNAFKEFASNNKISLTTYDKSVINKPLPGVEITRAKISKTTTSFIKARKPATMRKRKDNRYHVFDLRRSLRLAAKPKTLGSRFEFLDRKKQPLRRSQRLRNVSVHTVLQKDVDLINRKRKFLCNVPKKNIASTNNCLEKLSRRMAKKTIARDNSEF